jgi:3-oxoacyl-[acyl-carrier protein] reductase
MNYGNTIIFGASSGVGQAAAEYLKDKCKKLYTVSRRPSPFGEWIKTDLSRIEEIENLQSQLKHMPIDNLLYLGGTWETNAFTPAYTFESCSDLDLTNVVNVNLLAPIRVIQRFIPNLKKSTQAKIVIMGAAVDSLDHVPYKEVANVSSKYGLKGTVAALRQNLNQYKIGVTLINPGYLATPEVLADFESSGTDESRAIPMTDLFAVLDLVLRLSNRTNINEIDMPNM